LKQQFLHLTAVSTSNSSFYTPIQLAILDKSSFTICTQFFSMKEVKYIDMTNRGVKAKWF